jgi:hypothetical protein
MLHIAIDAKNQQKPVSGALNVLTYPIERCRPLQKPVGPALAAATSRGCVHALGWHVSVWNRDQGRLLRGGPSSISWPWGIASRGVTEAFSLLDWPFEPQVV